VGSGHVTGLTEGCRGTVLSVSQRRAQKFSSGTAINLLEACFLTNFRMADIHCLTLPH